MKITTSGQEASTVIRRCLGESATDPEVGLRHINVVGTATWKLTAPAVTS